MHIICSYIAPWANFIASHYSISIEPHNLIPNNLPCPADVGLFLLPSYLALVSPTR